jgi:hypothetical protein
VTLRCGGCCRPLATLEARPLTSLSPSERARMGECQSRRALVKDHVASSPRRLPSTDAPFACLRCAGNPPPYPGLSRRRAGFQHLAFHAFARKRFPCRGIRGSSPRRRAGQALPVDFCNHCGSPAQLRSDRPPRASPRVAPLRRVAGGACTSRCSAGRAGSNQGPPRASPSPAPPPRIAEELYPEPKQLGHFMSRIRACAAKRARHRNKEPCPAIRRRMAHKTPSAPGLRVPPSREARRKPCTRSAFHRRAA